MALASAECVGKTYAARQSQWQNTRRRRARGREKTRCAEEASSYGIDSATEKQDALQTDVDKMMDHYKENFPTISEISARNNSPQLEHIVSSVLVPEPNLDTPYEVPQAEESCKTMIKKLEQCERSEHHAVLLRLQKHVRMLAIQRHGSRVVQKAFEVATGSDRDAIIGELADHVMELYESPHGNHVLSRAIEVLPAAKFNFVISALLGKGYVVSKHKFGCRVVCRLIEHARAEQINDLVNEILLNIESLAQQTYGTFVVQSLLEHGAPEWKSCVVLKLSAIFGSLCMDRSGSLVAQKLLDCCDKDQTNYAIECLNSQGLVEVACTRFGSYVVEQLASMQSSCPAVRQSASILANSIQELHCSDHAEKVVAAFELSHVEPEFV